MSLIFIHSAAMLFCKYDYPAPHNEGILHLPDVVIYKNSCNYLGG